MQRFKHLKTILLTLLFLALTALALAAAHFVTLRKESRLKYADMSAAAAQTDVLFLGSSHVINGINPAQLYEEYGITGYNLGGHGSILPASYWELVLALDRFSPRLVVVDGYMMEQDYHYLDEMTEDFGDDEREAAVSQLHLNMDVFPLSRNKYRAVRDLIADPGTRWEFLFPFIRYHSRWSALGKEDLTAASRAAERNRLLGGEIRTNVAWQIAPHTMGDDEQTEEVHMGEQYLQMILGLCRERGIAVALTCLPMNSTAKDRRNASRLAVLSEAEGLPFLDLLTDNPTDFSTDYHDEGHLNLLGMTKATRAVGAFLKAQYDLPDHRGDASCALWAERAEDFREEKAGLLEGSDGLTGALLSLAADRTQGPAILYLPGTGAAIGDPAVRALADALVPDNGLRDAAAAGEPVLLLIPDTEGGETVGGYQVTEWTESCLGSLEVIQVPDFTGLYMNHDESRNLLDMEDNRLADAQLILRPGTEIEKQLIFNYKISRSQVVR